MHPKRDIQFTFIHFPHSGDFHLIGKKQIRERMKERIMFCYLFISFISLNKY
jgi:hypothetical protein